MRQSCDVSLLPFQNATEAELEDVMRQYRQAVEQMQQQREDDEDDEMEEVLSVGSYHSIVDEGKPSWNHYIAAG